MGYRGNNGLEASTSYTDGQVEAVLHAIDVFVMAETQTNILCFCPFHKNDDTPAFSVSKEKGLFKCFSPSCQRDGTLIELVMYKTHKNPIEAMRLINKWKGKELDLGEQVRRKLVRSQPVTFDINVINKMHAEVWNHPEVLDYLHGDTRMLTDESIKTFKIGYSENQRLVVVPMFDSTGKPVGVVGRPIDSHRFKNSRKLPTAENWFNLNRAKRTGDEVIVVEAAFDAIRVHQAGYPNVVAILGGHITDAKAELLRKYFNKIIIATDFDAKRFYENCIRCGKICKGHNPGRDIGDTIVEKLSGLRMYWAAWEEGVVYPHGAKDMSDMTDEEIRRVIDGAVSNFTYRRWNLY